MGYLHFSSRNADSRQTGFVLILVLLFLLSASFLVLASLETELLEMQMASHQQNKMMVFLNAESILKKMEAEIENGLIPPDITRPEETLIITLLGKDACQHARYQIELQLEKYNANIDLFSVFVQANDKKCPSKLPTGRIFWKEQ